MRTVKISSIAEKAEFRIEAALWAWEMCWDKKASGGVWYLRINHKKIDNE